MIHKELLDFLGKLDKNNNKPWFDKHKPHFLKLEERFKSQANKITTLLNQHDAIERTKIFRIYRDVRFSKDKTPFKAHRSVNWMREGNDRRGSYFLSIKPQKSVIGIGFFGPEKDDLLRIRKELEVDAQELRDIIEAPEFVKTWGVFQGEQLKTAPCNFDKNHPDIDLIRFKNFFFIKNYTDQEVQELNFFKDVDAAFQTARPFLDYMTDVLTTDLNGESLL